MPASKKDPLAKLPEHVFVTGGSGFIGSNVVARLAELGIRPRCLVLPDDTAPALAGLDYQRIDGDLSDPERLARAMDGCPLVIHLAAIYAIWAPRPARIFEVNVEGTRNIIAAARKTGVKRIVHTSSIAAVGHLPGRQLADETTLFNDWDVANEYVLSKYASELEALAACDEELEVVAVNPAFPYGPNDYVPTPTGRVVLDTLRGRLPFNMKGGGTNVVHVGDVAEGHLLAAVRGRPGERYVLGGDNTTTEELGELLDDLVGRAKPKLTLTGPMLKAMGRASELVADYFTRQQPLMTYKAVSYMADRFLWFSIDKAKSELGYQPRGARETIAASVEWFRSRL